MHGWALSPPCCPTPLFASTPVHLAAGVVQPDPVQGLHPADKAFVVKCLRALHAWAGSPHCPLAFESMRLVPWARVPILKLKLAGGPEVDVSFGDEGGCVAAEFAANMSAAHPGVLRPLVLVLKGMLRSVSVPHGVRCRGRGRHAPRSGPKSHCTVPQAGDACGQLRCRKQPCTSPMRAAPSPLPWHACVRFPPPAQSA